MSEKKYTEEDFESAEFAKHPDGRSAMRGDDHPSPWRSSDGGTRTDIGMAEGRWMPAPASSKPTITESDAREAWWAACGDDEGAVHERFAVRLGIETAPVPTNAERLAAILGDSVQVQYAHVDALAEFLDRAGVTAPEGADND